VRRSSGSILTIVVFSLVVLGVAATIVWLVVKRGDKATTALPMMHTAARGPFDHIVLEQGEVESSSNIELKCEVRSRSQGGGPSTSIIEVLDEGTMVKAGDLIVTLDSSALETEQAQQIINLNTAKAALSQAESAVKTAEIALQEYLHGVYTQEEKTILNEIFVAEEAFKKAQLSYDSVKRLVSRGVLNPLQLEGEEFKLDNAQNQMDLARGKLTALEKYTKEKMTVQLSADIEVARSTYDAALSSFKEEQKKLEEINDQIEKCKIYAPIDGQVVYANVSSRRGGSEFVVEPGSLVREQQTIIRLPDANRMQVKATINESRIALVKENMPCLIKIEAFEGRELKGRVTKVNSYAEPGSFFSSQVKEYATFVEILDPPVDLRTGMTAEVRIFVERLPAAVQVPIQAIYEKQNFLFCLKRDGESWKTQEVQIGSSNEKFVTITSGIEEGDRVVLNPRQHESLLELPDLPDVPISQLDRKQQAARAGLIGAESPPGGGPPGGPAGQAPRPDGPPGGGGPKPPTGASE
jgi:RND family efflux transporter MFP subunit